MTFQPVGLMKMFSQTLVSVCGIFNMTASLSPSLMIPSCIMQKEVQLFFSSVQSSVRLSSEPSFISISPRSEKKKKNLHVQGDYL